MVTSPKTNRGLQTLSLERPEGKPVSVYVTWKMSSTLCKTEQWSSVKHLKRLTCFANKQALW